MPFRGIFCLLEKLFITFINTIENFDLKIYNCLSKETNQKCECNLTSHNVYIFNCDNLVDELFQESEFKFLNNMLHIQSYCGCILNLLLSFTLTRYQNRILLIEYIINKSELICVNKKYIVFFDFIEIYILYIQFKVKIKDQEFKLKNGVYDILYF